MTEKQKKLNRVVFILSLVGLFIAIYVLQSFLRQSSIVCVNEGCELVRKSPHSYLLGIPVPGFGAVGYFLLIVLSILKTAKNSRWISRCMLGIASFGIAFVAWFTYTEVFIIKALCTWCVISAVIMYSIFFLLLKSYFVEKGEKIYER